MGSASDTREVEVTARDGAETFAFAADEQHALAFLENLVGHVRLDHDKVDLPERVLGAGSRGRARRGAAGDDLRTAADQRLERERRGMVAREDAGEPACGETGERRSSSAQS